jgi:integrase
LRLSLRLGRERKPLSVEEEASLEAVARPELAVVKRFALATSLRIEEIVTLTWPQVDWENREIRSPASIGWVARGRPDRRVGWGLVFH